jgi:hypothetical protein
MLYKITPDSPTMPFDDADQLIPARNSGYWAARHIEMFCRTTLSSHCRAGGSQNWEISHAAAMAKIAVTQSARP